MLTQYSFQAPIREEEQPETPLNSEETRYAEALLKYNVHLITNKSDTFYPDCLYVNEAGEFTKDRSNFLKPII